MDWSAGYQENEKSSCGCSSISNSGRRFCQSLFYIIIFILDIRKMMEKRRDDDKLQFNWTRCVVTKSCIHDIDGISGHIQPGGLVASVSHFHTGRTSPECNAVGDHFCDIVSALPVLLTGPFAGTLADRMNRKWMMITADAARIIIVGAFIFADQIWHVYVLLILKSLFDVMFSPAKNGYG